jgi:hypothetical protein
MARGLQSAGFTGIETFSFDLDVVFTHEDWVGRQTDLVASSVKLRGLFVSRADHKGVHTARSAP